MEHTPSTEGDGIVSVGMVKRHPPDEVFALLGDETRVQILQVLGGEVDEPITFSELQDRLGMSDSGQFNYHLRKLVGHFVRKVEEGYELTYAGKQLMGALHAGTYTASATMEPLEIESPCPVCEGTLVATYEDEHVVMSCEDCAEWRNVFPFPPGALEGFEGPELIDALDRWMWSLMERIYAGFCPNCSARLEGHVRIASEDAAGARVSFHCQQCDEEADFSLHTLAFFDMDAACFFNEHGLDLRTAPLWEIGDQIDNDVEILSEDPVTARIQLSMDGHTFEATIGPDLELRDIETSVAK